jgi:hypothetical protein
MSHTVTMKETAALVCAMEGAKARLQTANHEAAHAAKCFCDGLLTLNQLRMWSDAAEKARFAFDRAELAYERRGLTE